MILTAGEIIELLAKKATVLEVDLEQSNKQYLADVMALASLCDFSTEQVVDSFFTKAIQKGLNQGMIVQGSRVGTA